jgi:hypothetical protein
MIKVEGVEALEFNVQIVQAVQSLHFVQTSGTGFELRGDFAPSPAKRERAGVRVV